jgi:hypothetical protein
MLVAYLRGLLKPDYPFGQRSIIRENFVLSALSREQEANEIITRVSHETGYAALLSSTQANKLLKQHDKMLSLAFDSLRHKSAETNKRKIDIDGINKFVKMYKQFKAKGFLIKNAQ